jgi:hypothetical protein
MAELVANSVLERMDEAQLDVASRERHDYSMLWQCFSVVSLFRYIAKGTNARSICEDCHVSAFLAYDSTKIANDREGCLSMLRSRKFLS